MLIKTLNESASDDASKSSESSKLPLTCDLYKDKAPSPGTPVQVVYIRM